MSGGSAFNLYWVAAALLAGVGALLLLLPAGATDPLRRRNRRTAGTLFLLAGAVFAAVAAGLVQKLLG